YRIVDFVLSNFINSGIYSLYVLTQFKSQSLLQHLRDAWQFSNLLNSQFIIPVPAQMRKGDHWYKGTSDAIYQNIHLLELSRPEMVAVFGADHVYRMDISQMIAYYQEKDARGCVAALPIPIEHASEFGTMVVDEDFRILEFKEKVANPPEIPGRPGWTLASMGNYVFDTEVLIRELRRDASKADSHHDFGKNILPEMI
ncbi:MAG: glucose-1-phosphate adenylyltransferase, partial [Candidatus Accumulibacter sp.]|nr:glucose-1-phosphate adenylyltransferase [Accumulibacter sp.]